MRYVPLATITRTPSRSIEVQMLEGKETFLSDFMLQWYKDAGVGVLTLDEKTRERGVVFPFLGRTTEEHVEIFSSLKASGHTVFGRNRMDMIFIPYPQTPEVIRKLHKEIAVIPRLLSYDDFIESPDVDSLYDKAEMNKRILAFQQEGYTPEDNECEGACCYPAMLRMRRVYGFMFTCHFSHSKHSVDFIAAAHAYHGNTPAVMLQKVEELAEVMLELPEFTDCTLHIGPNEFGNDAHELAVFVPNWVSFDDFLTAFRTFNKWTRPLATVPDLPRNI